MEKGSSDKIPFRGPVVQMFKGTYMLNKIAKRLKKWKHTVNKEYFVHSRFSHTVTKQTKTSLCATMHSFSLPSYFCSPHLPSPVPPSWDKALHQNSPWNPSPIPPPPSSTLGESTATKMKESELSQPGGPSDGLGY